MEIRNHFDEVFIELNEKELILKKRFRTLKLDREYLQGAYLDNAYKMIILYKDKPINFSVVNVKEEGKIKIKELVDIINAKGNVFITKSIGDFSFIWWIILIQKIISSIILSIGNKDIVNDGIDEIGYNMIWIIISLILVIKSSFKYKTIIYNLDDNMIEYYDWKLQKQKVSSSFKNKKYSFKKSVIGYKFKAKGTRKSLISVVEYPQLYTKKLEKLLDKE